MRTKISRATEECGVVGKKGWLPRAGRGNWEASTKRKNPKIKETTFGRELPFGLGAL